MFTALFFDEKIVLFGLLAMFLVAFLSCGQFPFGNHGGVFGIGVSECSIATLTTSSFSSKDYSTLMMLTMLFIVLSIFMRRSLSQWKFYIFDIQKRSLSFILKEIQSISNQIQEVFRKGIIYLQIYDVVTASG